MATLDPRGFYRFLIRNWSAILSALSVSGYVLGYELHYFLEHRELFLFLGANAVIWTLVELKTSLRVAPPARRYPNMRAARSHITERLQNALSRRTQTTVTIVGGRIRTISDILRELIAMIQQGKIAAQNTTVTVCCLHPDYLHALLDKRYFTDGAHKRERFAGYGELIRQFVAEIDGFNRLPEMTTRNVRFEVVQYRSLPYFYCFVIDRSDLFWGFFTWNFETEDFDGPPNPCFYYSATADHYADFYDWLSNRAAFLRLTAADPDPVAMPPLR